MTFPVVPDADGELFRQLTTGWVPCSMLVGPDGKVLFWETEFDEAGFSTAIEKLYSRTAEPNPSLCPPRDRSGTQVHPRPPASSFWEAVPEGSWPHTICAGDSRRNTASS